MAMDELNWTGEPYYRRTKEEQALRDKLITGYLAGHNCRYNVIGEIVDPTAKPTPFDKHHYTPAERLTLDYEGAF